MKKKQFFEIIGVLSLSTILITTFSISGCVPDMLVHFKDYPRASVENLVSLPSMAIMCIIALTPFLSRRISSRTMVTIGLLIIGTIGMIPLFSDSYPVVFGSRILLGIGIGLVNTSAVSLIGEHFSGELRTKLQGVRCSMETLGQSAMTLLAGQLLVFGWNYAFMIYGFAFVILILFLTTVPKHRPACSSDASSNKCPLNTNRSGAALALESPAAHDTPVTSRPLTRSEWIITLQGAFLGILVISSTSIVQLRLASFILEKNIGNSVDSANVLSISIFAGFLGGMLFGKLYQWCKKWLLPLSILLTGVGMAIIMISGSLFAMTVGASFVSFFTTLILSCMFNRLSDRLPVETLTTANSVTLVGCNLGSTITPTVLSGIGMIHPTLAAGFFAYAVAHILLAIVVTYMRCRKPAVK